MRLTRSSYFVMFVLLTHIFVLSLLIYTSPAKSPISKKRLVLTTKTMAQLTTLPNNLPQTTASKKKERPVEPVRKKAVAKPVKKQQAATKAPQKKQSSVKNNLSKELLKKIEAQVSKLPEKAPSFSAKPIILPEPITLKEETATTLPDRESEEEKLIDYLQKSLRLPDYGIVKMKIILAPNKSIYAMHVLYAASEKNKKYLENQLPLIDFSQLQLYDDGNYQTYILTFCNES